MSDTTVKLGISAVSRTGRAFSQTRSQMRGLRRETGRMNSGVARNRRVIQQAGMQMSDFAVQVGGGQSAILAFTQNVPQFVQGFGAIGGVAAAAITVMGTLALVITRTGTSLNDLTPIAGILKEEFVSLAKAMGNLKEFAIDAANVFVNNLDRVFVYTATFITFMTGKWIAGLVRAAGAVGILTGAFTGLLSVLKLFGRVFVLLAFAELVFSIVALRKETGSWAATLDALKPVVRATVASMSAYFSGLFRLMEAGVMSAASTILGGLAKIDNAVVNMIRGGFKGLARIVAFLDKDLSYEKLAADLDKVNTSFTNFERLAGEAGRASDEAAKTATRFFKTGKEQAAIAGDEFRKLREIIKGGGSDIDIRDWFKGLKEGSKGVKDAADDVNKLRDAMKSGFDRLFDSIFEGGQKAIEVVRSLGQEILKIIARQSFFKFLAGAMPNLFGSSGMFDMTKSANGNVFNQGSLQKFAAGGIVSKPTLFPMRSGAGLMGEAGPEAIMPLTRRGGRLGVSASGTMTPVNIQIVNESSANISYEPTNIGGVTQHRFVAREVNRVIRSGEADGSLGGRFRARPTGVAR